MHLLDSIYFNHRSALCTTEFHGNQFMLICENLRHLWSKKAKKRFGWQHCPPLRRLRPKCWVKNTRNFTEIDLFLSVFFRALPWFKNLWCAPTRGAYAHTICGICGSKNIKSVGAYSTARPCEGCDPSVGCESCQHLACGAHSTCQFHKVYPIYST